MSVVDRLKRIVADCDDLSASACKNELVDSVRELAVVVRSMLEGAADVELEVGQEYEIVLRVRATVVQVSDAHGRSYELLVEQRDYVGDRLICVDADEIQSAR